MNWLCTRSFRTWVAAGMLGSGIALAGWSAAQADDDKPKKESKELPPPKERKRDERRPERLLEEPQADRNAGVRDILELQRAISEAARKGDFNEVSQLVQKLQESLGQPGGAFVVPLFPGMPELPGFAPRNDPKRQEMLRTLRDFENQIEQLKGQPEAQDAVRKSMEAYRKTMEKMLPEVPPRRGGGFGFGGVGEVGEPFGFGRVIMPGVPRGGTLGISFIPAPEYVTDLLDMPRGVGMIVTMVLPNSPADKAGFQKNDLLLSFGGEEVTNNTTLFLTLIDKQMRGGKPVDAVVYRKGKRMSIKGIELPKRERPEEPRDGGIAFQAMSLRMSNGEFTVEAANPSARYLITGEATGDEPMVNKITITVGEKVTEYPSLKEVPAEHQSAVKQLLGNVKLR